MEIVKPKQIAGRGITRDKDSAVGAVERSPERELSDNALEKFHLTVGLDDYVRENQPKAALLDVRDWAGEIREDERKEREKKAKRQEREEKWAWWGILVVVGIFCFPLLVFPIALLILWTTIWIGRMIGIALAWVWSSLVTTAKLVRTWTIAQ